MTKSLAPPSVLSVPAGTVVGVVGLAVVGVTGTTGLTVVGVPGLAVVVVLEGAVVVVVELVFFFCVVRGGRLLAGARRARSTCRREPDLRPGPGCR